MCKLLCGRVEGWGPNLERFGSQGGFPKVGNILYSCSFVAVIVFKKKNKTLFLCLKRTFALSSQIGGGQLTYTPYYIYNDEKEDSLYNQSYLGHTA